ncbi:hypothetical protein [uncultured Clostridium sp.]|uniref:hypothetical protein n=1 Tax=uncultured Clostridium sp. TaxID=59620 RepID=UPI00261B466C|nr:hypothetical protein [uncultured Clostridium sp.]
MSYGKDDLNDPMYREYVERITEEGQIESIHRRAVEDRIFEEEENIELRNEGIVEIEGFNSINNENMIDRGLAREGILEANNLYDLEAEQELEEDMDIMQEDRDLSW